MFAAVLSVLSPARAQSATIPGSVGINPDIGKTINNLISPPGNAGTINIPDGTYAFTTPIVIHLRPSQNITIHCSSRNGILEYHGSGPAISIISNQASTPQVSIENCSLSGGYASDGTDGIYLFDVQNFRLTNAHIYSFRGINIHGVGVVNSLISGSDIADAGTWNLVWEPDTVNRFGSNCNRMFGGSLVYGREGNYWDKGNFSPYGGNTGDLLDGVTLEEGQNCSVGQQFIVEGTWNASIRDSYIEYLPCASGHSSRNVFSGVVGNVPGSGIGTNTWNPTSNFVFENNYMITPRAGAGFTTASLFVQNTEGAKIDRITDNGPTSYGIIFGTKSANVGVTTDALAIGWQKALYKNPTTSGRLWVHQDGMITAPGQWQPHTGGHREWFGAEGAGPGPIQYERRQSVPAEGSPLCSANANSICTFHLTLAAPMADSNWHMSCQVSASTKPGVIISVSPPVSNSEVVVTYKDLSGLGSNLTSANCEAWE